MNKAIFSSMGAVAILALAATTASAADSYAEDRAQIENLQGRYMFAMDFRDADAYAGCFTEDGVLDYAGGTEKGRKAIHDFIVKSKESDAKRNAEKGGRPSSMRHNITNVVIKIEGNKAKARAYWTEFENRKDVNHAEIGSYGHYEDELVKQNGQWLFTKRVIFNEQLEKRAAPAKSPAW